VSVSQRSFANQSFYINLAASTAVKNAVSARHPRGPQRRRAAPEPGPEGAEMTLRFSRRAERGCH